MPNKKNLLLLAVSFFMTSFGYGQIITSKKEAVKKGIYQKPVEKKKDLAMVTEKQKTIAVVEADNKPKETKAAVKTKKYTITEGDDKDFVASPPENYIAVQIINNAMEFIGVNYRGGGTTKDGMDCSGMVTAVFNIFDLKLPRSSHEMATVGEKIDPKDAKKGDLIFFKTNGNRNISHVGIVVEVIEDEIKFIHSSTSKGVVVSSTSEPYYKKTFTQVNRVL